MSELLDFDPDYMPNKQTPLDELYKELKGKFQMTDDEIEEFLAENPGFIPRQ